MNRQKLTLVGALVATFIVGMAARPALAQEKETGERPSTKAWPPRVPSAKIGPLQAMTSAKEKLGGGTAFRADFEYDEGKWVYGVMVVKGHRISEVEVDPKTGAVVDSEAVTPSDEAQEAKEDLTKIAAAGG